MNAKLNLKKIIKILVILAIVAWFQGSRIFSCYAQQGLSDYQFQYEKYRGYQQNYVKTRETFLQYQTLTAKEEFIKASQEFLISRATVIHTYFTTLKTLLKDTADVVSEQKSYLILSSDNEINWLTAHEQEINNLKNPTLDDLLEISKRLEDKKIIYQKIAYQILSNVLLGKLRTLQSESGAINFLLADRINKSGLNKDETVLNQWLQAVRDMNYQSQKNIETAEDYINLLSKDEGGKSLEHYRKIQDELEQARLKLLQTINYQKEILGEVGNE